MKLKNVFLLYRIRSAMAGNRLIYWLTRIKLLNGLFVDRLYAVEDGKLALSMMGLVGRVLKAVLGKALYLLLACLVPLGLSDINWLAPEAFPTSVWIFFWLSFVAGTMIQPVSVEPSQMKYTCVRQMGMDATQYQITSMFTDHLASFAGFAPFLLVWAGLTGGGVFWGVMLSVALAAVRVLAEWFHLWLFARWGWVPSTKVPYILGMTGLCLAAAYVPMPFGMVPDLTPYLLHPATVTLLVALACICARGMARYPHHYRLIVETCRQDKVFLGDAQKKASAQRFEGVKLRDSDLDTGKDFSHLQGWRYLQAIFFRRHRRMLLKPFYIVLVILAVVTVVGCIVVLLPGPPEAMVEQVEVFSRITGTLPMCVFLLYLMDNTVGERICRAMFYNCDLALLRYGWYRERGAVLKNFFLRWRMLCGVNLMLSGAVCAMFVLLTALAGGRPPMGEFVLFLLAILSLGVFFATHSLAVYYLFQPYTSDLDTKSPMFKVLNFMMYLLCYLAIQIKSTPTWFALLVFGVTVVYSVVMLLLVQCRAPKTFRVK